MTFGTYIFTQVYTGLYIYTNIYMFICIYTYIYVYVCILKCVSDAWIDKNTRGIIESWEINKSIYENSVYDLSGISNLWGKLCFL